MADVSAVLLNAHPPVCKPRCFLALMTHPAAHINPAVAVGGGFFSASEFGGFTTASQWDAAAASWVAPRMEIDHVKVWAWPPPPGV
jgi:hypothetical protein